MILRSENVDIMADSKSGFDCLHFTFKGKFTSEASLKSSEAWKETFAVSKNRKFKLYWNCLQMTGFETSAKSEWMKCMGELKNQISSVVVISDNIVIRGASHLMLKFYGFEYQVFKTYDDAQKQFENYPVQMSECQN